jgi:hypothetical protein
MIWLKAFLVSLIKEIVFAVIEKMKPGHVAGRSDGTTEDRLKEKLRKKGWIK